MSTNDSLRIEDVTGLKSRISWSAVLAGSVVAFAIYIVLALFFAALGFSVSDAQTRAGTLGNGAMIAAAVAMIAALFVGGCVTTQLTAGETTREAVIHGVLTWATVTALSLMMVSAGVRAGYNAMLGAATAADNVAANSGNVNWEDSARRAGVPQERIDQLKNNLTPEAARANADSAVAAVQDPANREQAREAAAKAAWITLGGTLLAMAASIGGALAGAGPRFRLMPVLPARGDGASGPIVAH